MRAYYNIETRQFGLSSVANQVGGFMGKHKEVTGGLAGAAGGALLGRMRAKQRARDLGIEKGSDEYRRMMRNNTLAGAGIGAGVGAAAGYGVNRIQKSSFKKGSEAGFGEGHAAGHQEGLALGRSQGAEVARRMKKHATGQGVAIGRNQGASAVKRARAQAAASAKELQDQAVNKAIADTKSQMGQPSGSGEKKQGWWGRTVSRVKGVFRKRGSNPKSNVTSPITPSSPTVSHWTENDGTWD